MSGPALMRYLGIALASIGAVVLAGWAGALIVMGALTVLHAFAWEAEQRGGRQ